MKESALRHINDESLYRMHGYIRLLLYSCADFTRVRPELTGRSFFVRVRRTVSFSAP